MRAKGAIKGIKISFRNVTGQFIPVEYIRGMGITDVKETYSKFWGTETELYIITSCEKFYLGLSHEMKDMKFDFFKDQPYLDDNETVFERITKYSDIIGISLVNEDGTEEDEILIPWKSKDNKGNDEYINNLLTFNYSDDGDLIIEAKYSSHISKCLKMEYILKGLNTNISIPIQNQVMVVNGDIDEQTILCNRIKGIKSDELLRSKAITSISIGDTYVVQSDLELEAILNKQGSFIFIDNFKSLAERNSEIIDFINSSDNTFILMCDDIIDGINRSICSIVNMNYKQDGDQVDITCK